MKRNHHIGWAVPLALTAALSTFTPALTAQSPGSSPTQEQPQQQSDQQQSKTFTGKIMKLQNGNFALVTGQSAQGQASGHFLDNQDEAKKYEGKQVTVTGTLEVASNTIHVTKIESAA
jgi:hypothetical protein